MKSKLYMIAICLLISIFSSAQQGGKYKLWYDKPAQQWVEALPIGNGRIAAMVYGDPYKEKLQLNESTFWSGGPSRNDNPDGAKVLDSIRYYLFNGNYKRAQVLADKGFGDVSVAVLTEFTDSLLDILWVHRLQILHD